MSAAGTAPRWACPTACPRARCRCCSWSQAGGRTARSATSLHISQHTAANHVRSILLKTGCANRTEAATYAYRAPLAQAEPGAYDR